MKAISKISTLVFAALSVLFGAYSCTDSPPKKVVIEKTILKEVDSVAITNSNPETEKLQEEVLGLNKETQVEKQTIKKLNSEIKFLHERNDSLRTAINQERKITANLMESRQAKISENELQIRSLIQYLHKAWESLPGAGSSDYFLDLFLPEFSVSMMSIGIDDEAVVKTMNRRDFTAMLNDIRKRKDFSVQIGNVDYVYFDGQNDIYSIVYTAVLRSYQNETPVRDKSFVATVTLKKADHRWKIGKYSWTSMGHELIH